LLCAFPLEGYLAAVPSVFEKEEGTHRIYQALRDWSGVKPLVQTNVPSVECSALNAAHRGYVVLANHGSKAQKVTIITALPIHSACQVTPTGCQPLSLEGSHWTMELAPNDGAVVEWK
jgi:hypothetical protein